LSSIAQLSAALQAEPHRVDLVLALAEAQAKQGSMKLALALLQQAELLHPGHRELAWARVAIPVEAGLWSIAVREARSVLQAIPNHVRVWRLAGQAFSELGMLDAAIEAWGTAVSLVPDRPWPWFHLGNLLVRKHQLESAAGAFRKALEHGEPHAALLANLGMVLLHLGFFGASRTRLKQALELDPDNVSAWIGLAQCRATSGETDGAVLAFEAARERAPNRPGLLLAYGDFLVSVGRASEAEQLYMAVLARHPGHRRASMGLGMVRSRMGQHAEAVELLDPWMTGSDLSVVALSAWGRSCIRIGRAERARTVFQEQQHGIMSPSQLQEFHHTLGSVHAALGDRAAAFAAHQTGNRNRERPVDVSGFLAEVAEVSGRLQAPAKRESSLGKGLVFIVGMPRSGTSLTEQVLSRHPDVVAGGELPSLSAVLRDRADGQVNRDWAKRLVEMGPDGWDALGARYLDDACARAGVRRSDLGEKVVLTDKQPTNYIMLGAISRILPGARIVHCTRDPLDTCLSCFFQNFGPGHAWSTELPLIASVYRAYRAQMHWWITEGGIEVIPSDYERLVDDLEGEIRQLLERLGLSFHPDCLTFYESARDARTASVDQVRQPIYRSSIGRAQHYRPWLGPLIEALGDLDALPRATELTAR